MVPPEPPPRHAAQPQPAWGVRRRRAAQQGCAPGPMQRLPRPQGRGRRARGAVAASVTARIPARAPAAAPVRRPSRSAPAPRPRPGLPWRIRWIIRLSGPGGDRNFGEGREGRGQAAFPAPSGSRALPAAPEEGGPRRLPRVRAARPRRPARSRPRAQPPGLRRPPRWTPRRAAARRRRGGARRGGGEAGEGAPGRSRGLVAKVPAAPGSVQRPRCWEKMRPLGEQRRLQR